MSFDCTEIFGKLVKEVHLTNNSLITNMVNLKTHPLNVCIQTDITHNNYYNELKDRWDNIFNQVYSYNSKCTSLIQLLQVDRGLARNVFEKVMKNDTDFINNISNIGEQDVLNWIESYLIPMYVNRSVPKFEMSPDGVKTLTSAGKLIYDRCICQMHPMFEKLMRVYSERLKTVDKTQITALYEQFRAVLREGMFKYIDNPDNTDNPVNQTAGASLTIESELDSLIPNELGSLKVFFIKVISTYYNNLHPVIWAQIVLKSYENFFEALPLTKAEFFQFASKQLLLNSGPFILKILQMIRPVLTPELAIKYNLTKLRYPLLQDDQVRIILKNVSDMNMYTVTRNVSASVGHVCIAHSNKDPSDVFVIKIIKPLSIAQSCWEYKTLFNLYQKGECERDFVQNMLKSNGREMNVLNEIENIKKGVKYYSADYKDVFGGDIDAKLAAINVKEGVVQPNTWFSMAMTLAPGTPVADLVENDLLKTDTVFRAKLHRCLDLLVYKFFETIIQQGFYHGDLHAGNVFYSFKKNQLTLIDFGAVGELNLFDENEDTLSFIKIVIMSLFYNYDQILDFLTDLLNNKCPDEKTMISKESVEYIQLKEKLLQYKSDNIKYAAEEKAKSEESKASLFSSERVKEENRLEGGSNSNNNNENDKSIYDYLENTGLQRETVQLNSEKDRLSVTIETLAEKKTVSFVGVLEEIFKFYALSGVNIAIKFSEFYEFQKAYALLLGVLHSVGYSSFRISMAIQKGVVNLMNATKALSNISLIYKVMKFYYSQKQIR